ncbi:MFS transporter, partial [Amycolatopsis sp. NPDC003861]
SAALLALGTVAVFPFEMDTIVRLSGERLVATHYGFYNTVVGVGILLGNLATGTVFDLARAAGWPELPWLGLLLIGAVCAFGLRRLDRGGRLDCQVPEDVLVG